MDLIQVARALRPGTAWNCTKDANGNQCGLEQAIDGTPRVSVPTSAEISAFIAAQGK